MPAGNQIFDRSMPTIGQSLALAVQRQDADELAKGKADAVAAKAKQDAATKTKHDFDAKFVPTYTPNSMFNNVYNQQFNDLQTKYRGLTKEQLEDPMTFAALSEEFGKMEQTRKFVTDVHNNGMAQIVKSGAENTNLATDRMSADWNNEVGNKFILKDANGGESINFNAQPTDHNKFFGEKQYRYAKETIEPIAEELKKLKVDLNTDSWKGADGNGVSYKATTSPFYDVLGIDQAKGVITGTPTIKLKKESDVINIDGVSKPIDIMPIEQYKLFEGGNTKFSSAFYKSFEDNLYNPNSAFYIDKKYPTYGTKPRDFNPETEEKLRRMYALDVVEANKGDIGIGKKINAATKNITNFNMGNGSGAGGGNGIINDFDQFKEHKYDNGTIIKKDADNISRFYKNDGTPYANTLLSNGDYKEELIAVPKKSVSPEFLLKLEKTVELPNGKKVYMPETTSNTDGNQEFVTMIVKNGRAVGAKTVEKTYKKTEPTFDNSNGEWKEVNSVGGGTVTRDDYFDKEQQKRDGVAAKNRMHETPGKPPQTKVDKLFKKKAQAAPKAAEPVKAIQPKGKIFNQGGKNPYAKN